MIQTRLFYILCFSFLSLGLAAQEICDNGVDDDADGLIDLMDPECSCNGVDIIVPTSLFPNPSFEENSCEPGVSKAPCADGWVNPSEATPDYYNACNTAISGILPIARCPIPDGDKFFGISDISVNGLIWKEYVGTQLLAPMSTGTEYVLSFWVGFVVEPDVRWSSPSVEFTVYGNTSNTALDVPFDGTDCPTSTTVDSFGNPITPWQQIDMENIVNGGEGWKQVRIQFTATEDFTTILLGPSCTPSNGPNYYFLDNLVLSELSSFSNDFISVRSGQACSNDLILEVPTIANLDYQWYKDGIALIGQTGSIYNVAALPIGNGSYTCVISNAFGCSMSEEFLVDESGRAPQFVAPTGMCPGDEINIGLTRNYMSYDWGAHGNAADITVTTPDIYQVTVVDSDGCILEASYDLRQYDDVQYTYVPTKESAPGALDGSIRIDHESGVSNPGVLWWDATTNNPHLNLAQGIYCVTVSADERCPVSECIDLELEIQALSLSVDNNQVRCFNESNGSLDLNLLGGVQPFEIAWRDHPEWDNLQRIENLLAGTYYVSITDQQGLLIDTFLVVEEPRPLSGQLLSVEPTCFGDMNGSIWVDQLEGGNGGYTYFWNGNSTPQSDRLDNISGRQYNVVVRDSEGCELLLSENLREPDPISALVDIVQPYCIGADDGSIHVRNIGGGTAPFEFFLNNQRSDADMFDLVGDQTYQILIRDVNGCEFGQEVFLSNQNLFTVDLGPAQTVEEYFIAHIKAISNLTVGNFEWSSTNGLQQTCTDCATINLPIETSEFIILNATSIEGCIASDSLTIHMTPSKEVYIPNAFSPNNDGVNDVLELYNAGEVEMVQYFKVFNRHGVKIFDVTNTTQENAMEIWNLSVQQHDQNPGAYIYMLGLQFKDGSVKEYKGDVSVIR